VRVLVTPTSRFLRRRFAREFADAFQATLAELTTNERNVLKLHYSTVSRSTRSRRHAA
jgi:hypothetical protein